MPDKNGYEICQELRQFFQGGIVFLTGHENPEVEVACFGLGADDFVPKSAPFKVLHERIKRLGYRPKERCNSQQLAFGKLQFIPAKFDCYFMGKALGLT